MKYLPTSFYHGFLIAMFTTLLSALIVFTIKGLMTRQEMNEVIRTNYPVRNINTVSDYYKDGVHYLIFSENGYDINVVNYTKDSLERIYYENGLH